MRIANKENSPEQNMSGYLPDVEPKRGDLSSKIQEWITAKKKYNLSDVQVQMARELGMNPKKFVSLSDHKQKNWKAPLPEFIEELYFKRFRKEKPD